MSSSNDDSSGGRNALGRGLENLIPDRNEEGEGGRLVQVPIADIERPPDQPRTYFDETGLEELAESISESGVIQPLVVREGSDGYELIAGERRLRASRKAGLDAVPVVIREVSDAEAYALALVENIQREDLNPIEEATAYERLKAELGLTQAELAEHLGKSRSAIANATRLLKLPEAVQQMLVEGDLSSGHARALISLDDELARQIAERIVDEDLSVREAEKLAKRAQKKGDDDSSDRSSGSRYRDDAQVNKIKTDLQRALGTKVELKDKHGKGRVEIHYDDYEILQSVLDRILKEQG
jgi:ParB family chromosome partitioning protein